MASPVQALSIVDAVATDLRDRLFNGALGSDALLTESEVASSYGVARPTAKAAIERLVSEGLLVRGKHKTARVPAMGSEDVRDLYFSRMVIEGEVVRRLAEQRNVPPGLQEANAELLRFGGSSDIGVVEPIMRFHMQLVHALGSPRIDRLFGMLMSDMRLCMGQMHTRRLLRALVIADEHDRILEEIAAGNAETAAAALIEHLTQAQNRLVLVLEDDLAEPDSAGHAS
ncbi:MAG: FCD domain-containing protein [Micromonosporaceae bacterium]|nr:FCD domain-containing protein [Micromonosporaceae bacterium]